MNELALTPKEPLPVARPSPTPADILQAVVDRGITSENVAVVKDLVAMCREVRAEEARAAFAKDFFQLRKEAPEIYADKEVKTKNGASAFTYCSPEELNKVVEPLLLRHGFTTMSGQEMPKDGHVLVTLTLMHEQGHSETRSYTIRVSPGNELMNPTKCDAAATTSALRHLTIKMLGLKTRIRAEDDARNEGEAITKEQAQSLRQRVAATGTDQKLFLKLGDAQIYEEIPVGRLEVLEEVLTRKEQAMAKQRGTKP